MSDKNFVPNIAQVTAARNALINFLTHGQHFCPFVDACEYVCRMKRFGLIHYVFRFCSKGGPWMVAVSGGFSSDTDLEPDLYIGTDGTLYAEKTVEQVAQKLLDRMHFFAENEELDDLLPDSDQILTPEEMDRKVSELQKALRRIGVDVNQDQMRQMMELDQAERLREMEREEPGWEDESAFISQKVLLSSPVSDLSAVADSISDASYHNVLCEKDDDALCFRYRDARVRVSCCDDISKEEIERAAEWTQDAENALKDPLSCAAAILVEAESEELSETDLAYFSLLVIRAILATTPAMGVLTSGPLLSKEAYIRILEDSHFTNGFPLDLFVCVAKVTHHGVTMHKTFGMPALGAAEILSSPEPDYDVDALDGDLLDMAYDLLLNDSLMPDPTADEDEMYVGHGGSGWIYRLHPFYVHGEPEDEDEMPIAWLAAQTKYVWMDEPGRIMDTLRSLATEDFDPAAMMNRLGYFVLWAYKRKKLDPIFVNDMDHGMAESRFKGDIRLFLLELVECLDTRIFKPEAARFVEDYYCARHPQEGFYADLRDYTLAHTYAPQDVIRMQSAGREAPALGEWSEKVFQDICKLLDERFAEWKKRK